MSLKYVMNVEKLLSGYVCTYHNTQHSITYNIDIMMINTLHVEIENHLRYVINY